MWDNYGNRGKTIGEAIDIAFSVEPVTKDFFETYREIFEEAEASIIGFGESEADQEEKHLFTQTLFNRLMFVYFLSRKAGSSSTATATTSKHYGATTNHSRPQQFLRHPDPTAVLLWSEQPQVNGLDRGAGNPHWRGTIPQWRPVRGNQPRQPGGHHRPDETIEQTLSRLFDKFNFTVMESRPSTSR